MECAGRITDISKSIIGNTYKVTLEINADSVNQADLMKCAEIDKLRIKAAKWTQKRSLDANAYFHVLVGKIADALTISKTKAKNILISRYGQIEMVDEEPVVIKTNIQPEQMWEQEFLHCMPCKTTIENEKEVVFYRVYRGSHTYDTKEMSVLINGTVEEAKALGIETMTPAEIERMVQAWRTSGIR